MLNSFKQMCIVHGEHTLHTLGFMRINPKKIENSRISLSYAIKNDTFFHVLYFGGISSGNGEN